jgi:myosin heavy subunit
MKAIEGLGCTTAEMFSLLSVLAAILHLGNLQVSATGTSFGWDPMATPHLTESQIASGASSLQLSSSTIEFDELCTLLGVGRNAFEKALLTQSLKVFTAGKEETRVKLLNEIEIRNNVSALIKLLYWYVRDLSCPPIIRASFIIFLHYFCHIVVSSIG